MRKTANNRNSLLYIFLPYLIIRPPYPFALARLGTSSLALSAVSAPHHRPLGIFHRNGNGDAASSAASQYELRPHFLPELVGFLGIMRLSRASVALRFII